MKILFGLLILFVCVPVVAQNYQAGGANRPNFGRSAALEQNDSSAPGAKSKVQTRTFSNYSSRHGNWDQGVKTQGVQTQTAGTVQQPSAPQTFEEQVAQTDRAVDAKLTGQRPGAAGAAGAVAPTGKKAAAPQAEEEKPAPSRRRAAGNRARRCGGSGGSLRGVGPSAKFDEKCGKFAKNDRCYGRNGRYCRGQSGRCKQCVHSTDDGRDEYPLQRHFRFYECGRRFGREIICACRRFPAALLCPGLPSPRHPSTPRCMS